MNSHPTSDAPPKLHVSICVPCFDHPLHRCPCPGHALGATRTLVLGRRALDPAEAEKWLKAFEAAQRLGSKPGTIGVYPGGGRE